MRSDDVDEHLVVVDAVDDAVLALDARSGTPASSNRSRLPTRCGLSSSGPLMNCQTAAATLSGRVSANAFRADRDSRREYLTPRRGPTSSP